MLKEQDVIYSLFIEQKKFKPKAACANNIVSENPMMILVFGWKENCGNTGN